MSILDKPKFSANDFVKGAVLLCSIGSMWYNLKLDIKDVKQDISEVKTYKNADDKVINARVDRLEILTENTSNKTNEIERNVIRLMAIVPSFKLKIEDENN